MAQICVAATISGETIRFDFAGTSGQVAGSLNAVGAIARSACFYVVACLLGDVPLNAGTFAPVEVVTPRASVVDASFPAAVAGGNVETSQRIVDVVTQALGAALPDQIPACSAGTMNNLTMGGLDANGAPWTYYETLGGGAGASCLRAGASAVQTHMTNTLNTPIEALERAFPLRVREYRVRRGSGGDGLKRGGDGLVREYEFLSDATVTMLSTRRATAPPGANGGQNGASGRNLLNLDAQAANAQAANAQAANAQAARKRQRASANAQAANAQAANAQAATRKRRTRKRRTRKRRTRKRRTRKRRTRKRRTRKRRNCPRSGRASSRRANVCASKRRAAAVGAREKFERGCCNWRVKLGRASRV